MSPKPVSVVVAGPEHADRVGGMLHDFNVEFDTPTPPAAVLADRMRVLLGRDDVVVVLSGPVDDPTGFGYLTLRPTPWYDGSLAQLEELYVRPGLRNQGIGTALLTTAIDVVLARGAAEVHINVDEVDADTRRFYERHGFVNVEPGTDYRMLCYLREL